MTTTGPLIAHEAADEAVPHQRETVVADRLDRHPVAGLEPLAHPHDLCQHGVGRAPATAAARRSVHSSNGRSVSAISATVGDRVDPHHRAGAAEVTERLGGVVASHPVRVLGTVDLDPESPGARRKAAHPRHDTAQIRELRTRSRRLHVSRREQRGSQQLVDEAHAGRRRASTRRGRAIRAALTTASPTARARLRAGTARTACRLRLRPRADELETGVRVDPASPRPRDRLAAVERVPTGVRQQVPQRAAAWTSMFRRRSSSVTMPSSTATSAAHAASGLLIEARSVRVVEVADR